MPNPSKTMFPVMFTVKTRPQPEIADRIHESRREGQREQRASQRMADA
jgi:hypothetical protein